MSSMGSSDLQNSITTGSKNKKTKKKKSNKSKANGDSNKANGAPDTHEDDNGEVGDEEEAPTPSEPPSTPLKTTHNDELKTLNGERSSEPDKPVVREEVAEKVSTAGPNEEPNQSKRRSLSMQNRTAAREPPVNGLQTVPNDVLEDLERLRNEVSQLKISLAEEKEAHETETTELQTQLDTRTEQKELAETQYQSLLGKVNTIRTQLGERLKADAEDLAQARSRIEELEEQNGTLHEQQEAHKAELAALAEKTEAQSKELSGLRNRTTLSQQNWTKEREELTQREAFAKEEFEAAKQAMQDWEMLAMEERSIRENISEKVADLEEQVASHRGNYEKAASERDSQSNTVDGLQRALQEIQDARRRELREVVENSQSQIESLQRRMREVEEQANIASKTLESTKIELERVLPFEKEVKEKNLLIGKLRHEAVILNDHLTKALRYLKKGKPEDTIDKQLITNHFMHFLALERGDPKKFQILQIIASLLAWTEEQREHAGLSRPGASNSNSRIPVSPWHRTPSTPALSADFFPDSGARKESLAELWSGFLEQQTQDESSTPKSQPSSSSGSKPP